MSQKYPVAVVKDLENNLGVQTAHLVEHRKPAPASCYFAACMVQLMCFFILAWILDLNNLARLHNTTIWSILTTGLTDI